MATTDKYLENKLVNVQRQLDEVNRVLEILTPQLLWMFKHFEEFVIQPPQQWVGVENTEEAATIKTTKTYVRPLYDTFIVMMKINRGKLEAEEKRLIRQINRTKIRSQKFY